MRIKHSIKLVAQLTGLSPHVIRAWEKRYGAIRPHRSSTHRREFTEEDVARLQYLKRLTDHGHNIGSIARLRTSTLKELAINAGERSEHEERQPTANRREADQGPQPYQERILEAIRKMGTSQMGSVLDQGLLDLGLQGLLVKVVAPLLDRIGNLWETGELTVAQEHFASASIKGFLEASARPYTPTGDLPNLVVATPLGQLHELGAMLIATIARNRGWHVTYLGPSLPANEIASAARQRRSHAVALSLIYPPDDSHVEAELRRLKDFLPDNVTILAGGRALDAYDKVLREIGAVVVHDLDAFSTTLDKLRMTSPY